MYKRQRRVTAALNERKGKAKGLTVSENQATIVASKSASQKRRKQPVKPKYKCMAIPIIYTFFGVGSGTLGTNQFDNASFVITVPADASTASSPTNLYPEWATQVNCPQATATISVLGLPTAIFGFALNVTLFDSAEAGLFWISVGLAPDQLVIVKNLDLRNYNLKQSLNPLAGMGPFPVSQNPYPITAIPGNLRFTSINSAAFQATLLSPQPPSNLHVIGS
jgi:hypothetical protein